MATQTVAIRAGARVTGNRARSVVLSVGVGLGIGSLPWNTSNPRRSSKPHLPPPHVSPVLPDGKGGWRWNPEVYKAIQWVFNEALGGLDGPTLPQVVATVTQTQAQVVSTTNYVDQSVQYTRAAVASQAATAQVVQNAGLPGADTIPPTPDPPSRPSGTTEVIA